MGDPDAIIGLGDGQWSAQGKKGWRPVPNKALWQRLDKETNIQAVREYNTSKVFLSLSLSLSLFLFFSLPLTLATSI